MGALATITRGAASEAELLAFEERHRDTFADEPAALLGAAYESLLGAAERRRTGAHFTPPELATIVASATLAPLLEGLSGAGIARLRVCDPAMGAGAFLLAALRILTSALADRWGVERAAPPLVGAAELHAEALAVVARECLCGVDKDPIAVEVGRLTLSLVAKDAEPRLVAGDSLVERASDGVDFRAAFPDAFERGGFDAIVGNPPWVSYAGRAAQPLAPALRAAYAESPAFGGYRNLQALFVHRAATLLRPGGRLGFVLPTSMADLAGYTPSRAAHDALCDVDPELPNFGDSFEGVFQPCMALLSTRRSAPRDVDAPRTWRLARSDLDAETIAVLAALDALPRFPAESFGERGFQSERGDTARFVEAPDGARASAIRTGTEVAPFERKPPRWFLDPAEFGARLRGPEAWRAVDVLIRQTSRYPMAARADGTAFRNSVLAAFGGPTWSAEFLVAFLNASPVRFYHFMKHRDAREGMPQLKIGHLRALPCPVEPSATTEAIADVGRSLSLRNDGIRPAEQVELDRLVCAALGLDDVAAKPIEAWRAAGIR